MRRLCPSPTRVSTGERGPPASRAAGIRLIQDRPGRLWREGYRGLAGDVAGVAGDEQDVVLRLALGGGHLAGAVVVGAEPDVLGAGRRVLPGAVDGLAVAGLEHGGGLGGAD